MIDKEYDHIIGLGGHCQTAYQIRRYFGVRKAYPFDWWVTPTIGLVELVETEFSDLFKEDNLKIVHEKTGPAVTCTKYHLMHYHDFDEAKINGHYSPYLVRTQCAKNHSKFSYLISRFLNLKGKILFIRFSHGWTEFDDRTCIFDEVLLKRLIDALNKMLPNAEITFLLLNDYKSETGLDTELMPQVYASAVNNYDSKDWFGSNIGWDEFFERHQFKLKADAEASQ